jgi:hypothetical protein
MTLYKKFKDKNLYGSNNLSANDMFIQRKAYEAYYPDRTDPSFPKPIDFHLTNYYSYGLMDSQRNYIIPNPNFSIKVPGTKKQIYTLDFVANAYEDFVFYMNTKASVKMVFDEGKIKDGWEAQRAWREIDDDRDQIKEGFYKNFVLVFLDSEKKRKIRNFNDFMYVFINEYLDFLPEYPITYSGFIESEFYDRASSGLCIDIYKDDYGNDYKKFDKFINNRNFRDYATAAASKGFLIDKHAPFRLVANISSPKMIQYASPKLNFLRMPRNGQTTETETPNLESYLYHKHEFNIDEDGNGFTNTIVQTGGKRHRHKIINYKVIPDFTAKANEKDIGVPPHTHNIEPVELAYNTQDLYDSYFLKVKDIEIEDLKKMFIGMYERFYRAYSFFSTTKYCEDLGTGFNSKNAFFRKLNIKTVHREKLSNDQLATEYTDIVWQKLYFLIRLREMKVSLEERKKTNVLAKIEDLYFKVDKNSSMNYISNYLKQFY